MDADADRAAAIAATGAATIATIGQACVTGTGCGACRPELGMLLAPAAVL